MADDPRDRQKQEAGERAVEWIESGMTVGLGTGSTAIWAIRKLGALLASGELREIVGVPTSDASATAATDLGIRLATLATGAGGALLHEKVVAQASRLEVIVVDGAKPSSKLGTLSVLPVEVIPFAAASETAYLESIGATVVTRTGADGTTFVTDEANHILDCDFGPIDDPQRLDALLHTRAGIVEHGLFLGLTTDLLVAGPDGVEHRTAP